MTLTSSLHSSIAPFIRRADVDRASPIVWDAGSDPSPLQSGCTHVWHMALDHIPPDAHEMLAATLDTIERAKIRVLRLPTHGRRFVACHGLVRVILAGYLDLQPPDVRFRIRREGKPEITNHTLQFNLSHSGGDALLAVTEHMPIGIDLECVNAPPIDWIAVSQRYFTPTEAAAIAIMQSDDRRDACLELWTRKEALLKARGEGLRGLQPDFSEREATLRTFRPTADTVAAIAWLNHA